LGIEQETEKEARAHKGCRAIQEEKKKKKKKKRRRRRRRRRKEEDITALHSHSYSSANVAIILM
jgi:hypothetical protein